MPQKTIYVKQENLKLFERAEEISGDSLSNILVDAIKLYIDQKEMENGGFEKYLLNVGNREGRKINLKKICFWGNYLAGGEDITENNTYLEFEVYNTKQGKVLFYVHESLIGKNTDKYSYYICSSIDKINNISNYKIPNNLIESATEALNVGKIEFLDI